MTALTLVIGDKNLSSWSLRPWLAMKQADIPFTEDLIFLDRPDTRAEILKRSPSARVPCLIDGNLVIWDSLAICEFLAEKFPDKNLWPNDQHARAIARAVAAEMHSGFFSLRNEWPMKFATENLKSPPNADVSENIERISEIWEMSRRDFGARAGGPFLFGAFSIADAFYAPVVSRFQTYGPLALPPLAAEWFDMMRALPAMQEWGAGAKAEVS
ncbi:MAG: glutathione S-transferase family protein [Parvularculaceae bacterium]